MGGSVGGRPGHSSGLRAGNAAGPAMSHPRLLVLLDIDGTLVWRASRAHATAVVSAIHRVHGPIELTKVDAAGRTDRFIVRGLLRSAGFSDAVIDAEMDAVLAIAAQEYEANCPADLSETVLPGIPALLATLAADPALQLGLVTGNIEAIAHRKLTAAGLAAPLTPWIGAYGSDHEDRNRLVPLAQQRAAAHHGLAAPWAAAATVVVGDTPHDIACARAARAGVIAVPTGAFTADLLTGADLIAHSPDELADELLRLADQLD